MVNIKRTKMYRSLLLIFALIPFFSLSQINETHVPSEFEYGISAGFNYSKLYHKEYDLDYGTKPFIGFYSRNNQNKYLSLRASIQYSIKGSTSTTPFLKFENHCIDFSFVPQFKISEDLSFQAGASLSACILSNHRILDGDNSSGSKRVWDNNRGRELSIPVGIELKLQDNLNLEFNYYIPVSSNQTNSFQLGININLNHRTSKNRWRKENRQRSIEQINQLKTGVLLVRLNTSENTIDALKKTGHLESALKHEKDQEIENKTIIASFKRNFDFCEVRFFFSTESESIRAKNYTGVFLNDSLLLDNSLGIDPGKAVFIAVFDEMEQDSTKYFSHYSLEPRGSKLEKVPNYYSSGPVFDFEALIILDENFVPLKKPFPYYSRAIYRTLDKHPELAIMFPPVYLSYLLASYDKTIESMNWNLWDYYEYRNGR